MLKVSATVDLDQLRRIFDLCDIVRLEIPLSVWFYSDDSQSIILDVLLQNGDNVISLEEFQFTAGLIRTVPKCQTS